MDKFDYETWVTATYQDLISPEIGRARIESCLLCDKDAETDDEYCEDHQRCIICGDNEDCECEEYWSERSNCCEAKMDTDFQRCYQCKENCISSWDDAVEGIS